MDNIILRKEIGRILLQDNVFIRRLQDFCSDSIEIPTHEIEELMAARRGNGTTTRLIAYMLDFWRSQGRTYLELIEKLKDAKFVYLSEELMKYLTKDQNTTESGTGTAFEIVPPAQSDSVGMKHRILKVVERLGFGSFSQVFKVQCRFTKKFYAVKCISVGNFVELTKPSGIGDAFDYFRKLLREVQIMAMLQENPNIISYHETWFEGTLQNRLYELLEKYDEIPSPQMSLRLTTEDKKIQVNEEDKNTFMCIRMELMDTNLESWLEENPHYIGNYEMAKNFLRQILAGLVFMHKNNAFHRDLKPANILLKLLNENGIRVKIGDFGLARDIPESDSAISGAVGSPLYASPEMERHRGCDGKTDVFSLGLTCLVMLHPFQGRELERTFQSVKQGNLTIVNTIEENHGVSYDLLRKMLAEKKENRISSEEALKLLS